MKNKNLLIISGFTVVLICITLLPVKADIVQIDTGEEYDGKITDLETAVRLEMLYGTITIPKFRIMRIISQKTIPEIYEEKLNGINQKDAEARYQLALWCKKQGWTFKMKEELEITIELNTNHEGARRMLGYHKLNGEWLTEDEYMIAKGFVKYQDKWVPKELAVELAKLEQTKEAAKTKEKEQKERRELFERTQKLAIASAFAAQQLPRRTDSNFEFKYNFEDGSGFSVKAATSSMQNIPYYSPYLGLPVIPTVNCTK